MHFHEGLFHKLFRKNNGQPSYSVVMLPKRAACFDGRITVSLPPDFKQEKKQKGQYSFIGGTSALRLTVMQMPFQRNVRRIAPLELQVAFRHLISPTLRPALTRGFLHRSPTLTAVWQRSDKQKTVLHLIQVRRTVYLLFLEGVRSQNADYVQPILDAVSIKADQ